MFHLDGAKQHEGVVEVKSEGGTSLIVNDVINNLPKLGGVMGFMLAPTGAGPAVPRIFRWFFVKDKTKFKSGVEQLAATPQLKRVIVSHGKVLDQPAQQLKSAIDVSF
jgi:hypothetical protein